MTLEVSNEEILLLIRALERQLKEKAEMTRLAAGCAEALLERLRSRTDTPPTGVRRLTPTD
jgi:hypothetical protein